MPSATLPGLTRDSAQTHLQLYATQAYALLGRALMDRGDFEGGVVEARLFPDGERYRRIESVADGRDVILLGGTIDDQSTLELFDLACALVHRGAHTLTLVIPFFGYQTMERAVRPGEVVVAKTRARLLSSIPLAGSGNRAVLLDLHSEGITHYFSDPIRPVHLYAQPVVLELIRELAAETDADSFVLGATDAGRAKWVEHLANQLGVDAAFVFKRRLDGERTEVTAMSADVRGREVVLYDDMIRTGGSLLGAARAYLDAGASGVSAVCTHGVFPGEALAKLRASGLLRAIAATDSHPNASALAGDFLRVRSVADVLHDFLVPAEHRDAAP
ncbi:MAG: ribose-phosphate pyrophosphokinase [Deltaproteobacteria bacterium]|nr:ribose-phosphate pyrophosphokinase [Deltaproteobacteria bacterium]